MSDDRDYLIYSIEHLAWWRPGERGYTRVLSEAGRYDRTRADAIVQSANIVHFHECLIPADCVAAPLSEPVRCMNCGKAVSGIDPELGLVVRAWVECPECLAKSGELATEDA